MGLTVGYVSFGAAALAYLGLALYYLLRGSWGSHGFYLLTAALLTAAWAAVSFLGHDIIPLYAGAAEALRHLAMLAWCWLLWHIVASLAPHRTNFPRRLLVGWVILIGATIVVVTALAAHIAFDVGPSRLPALPGFAVALLGLSLTETLYRSYQAVERWKIKFLCLATGGLFAYDIFFYADGLLFKALDPTLLEVRGLAQVVVVPCLVINIQRSKARHFSLGLSQRLVFGSTVLLGTGLYLTVMAAAAYYVRSVGGAWGSAVQTVFLFASILLLLTFLLSGSFRARLRYFLSHHVLRNKYDYRAEWLRFSERLARADDIEPFDRRIIRALADIVDSPAGALWSVSETNFPIAAGWNTSPASLGGFDMPALVTFFETHNQLWEIGRPGALPNDTPAPFRALVERLLAVPEAWVLIPLRHQDRLIALLLLTRPRSGQGLSPEDSELLQIASHQAAGYLSEQRAARALAEAREFERFNQRYAFVAHDIKNLVSQLSLMLRNIEKYGNRADFRKDMLATVQSVVERMNSLMARLSGDASTAVSQSVEIRPLIEAIIDEKSFGCASITLDCPADLTNLQVCADTRRVDAILRHLFQNAIDSSGDNGKIVVGLRRDRNAAVIEVRDAGTGMDMDFIQNELFRPFRSTKNGGMGIGAFQCRTYARELGGDLEAISCVGAGTTMRVTLPVLYESSNYAY